MPEKILVVNMNYLGDALMTTPALSALRQAHPDARIDTIAGAGAAAVLQHNPDIDSVIVREARAGWKRLAELYYLLRAGRYTMVVHLPPIQGYAVASFLSRTPQRVGQGTRQMRLFLTERRTVNAAHFADRMMQTMPVPEPPPLRRLVYEIDAEGHTAARALLCEAGLDNSRPLIAVNLGATRPQKRWQAEAFAELLDLLTGYPCVLVGAGAGDASLAREILSRVKRQDACNFVDRTNLTTLAALLATSAVLVTADSGPMHLATAVGTPAVALFGSTDPELTGPYDNNSVVLYKHLPCAPCFKRPTCGGRFDCMRALLPEDVAQAVRNLLRRTVHPLPMTKGTW